MILAGFSYLTPYKPVVFTHTSIQKVLFIEKYGRSAVFN
jgi:hypothetical protein